jgi:hypothetical protein
MEILSGRGSLEDLLECLAREDVHLLDLIEVALVEVVARAVP